MTKLEKQLGKFINERIVEELYESGIDDNKYSNEIKKMIQDVKERLGEDSNAYGFICKLYDLCICEMTYRDEKAYALGFIDALNIKNSINKRIREIN